MSKLCKNTTKDHRSVEPLDEEEERLVQLEFDAEQQAEEENEEEETVRIKESLNSSAARW